MPYTSKEKRRETDLKNRELRLATNRAWRAAHREELRAYSKKWASEHPEYREVQRQRSREYRAKNADTVYASNRAYRAANPDKVSAWNRASDHTRRAAGKRLKASDIRAVFERYGKVCVYCGAPGSTIDHFVPVSRGGTNEEHNLVPACKPCNSSKFNEEPFSWMMKKGIRFDIRGMV